MWGSWRPQIDNMVMNFCKFDNSGQLWTLSLSENKFLKHIKLIQNMIKCIDLLQILKAVELIESKNNCNMASI
jgi:hypothetical protein